MRQLRVHRELRSVQGGHDAIYATAGYRRLRVIAWSVGRKFLVAGAVFLPALYAIWFRVKPLLAGNLDATEQPTGHETPLIPSPSVATSAVSQRRGGIGYEDRVLIGRPGRTATRPFRSESFSPDKVRLFSRSPFQAAPKRLRSHRSPEMLPGTDVFPT
jgi:hypothetical protein